MDDRKPYAAILRLRDDVRSLPEFAREHALADIAHINGLLNDYERHLVWCRCKCNLRGGECNRCKALSKLRAERGEGTK